MKALLTFSSIIICSLVTAQPIDSLTTVKPETVKYSPYIIKWKIDVPITVIGFGTNYLGLRSLRSKKAADTNNISNLSPDDIKIRFDRAAAKQDPSYANTANLLSDISLVSCFVLPGALLLDRNIRSDAGKVILMHLETQAIMANMYFLTMTISNRRRPYVYNTDEDPKRRGRVGNNNSFYGGHASHAASCSFFIAKILSDYYPERNWKPYLYSAALIPPGVVGYFRYKGGQHFPTDLIVGTTVGAAVGILIPELHKPRKKKNRKKLEMSSGLLPGSSFALRYIF